MPPPSSVGETNPVAILNDFYSDYSQVQVKEPLREFSIFPGLPFDISAAIWKCVLQRHRLIRITVVDNDDNSTSLAKPILQPLYTARNGLGNTISGKYYRFFVTSNHSLSPLLRVCRESRLAALQFYRVHIPYDFNTYGKQP